MPCTLLYIRREKIAYDIFFSRMISNEIESYYSFSNSRLHMISSPRFKDLLGHHFIIFFHILFLSFYQPWLPIGDINLFTRSVWNSTNRELTYSYEPVILSFIIVFYCSINLNLLVCINVIGRSFLYLAF